MKYGYYNVYFFCDFFKLSLHRAILPAPMQSLHSHSPVPLHAGQLLSVPISSFFKVKNPYHNKSYIE